MGRLAQTFFARDTLFVARALLGQRLVRVQEGQRQSGLISETEAYTGPDDAASHAYRRTVRSDIMYGPAGIAYVYIIYGKNYCLNAVARPPAQPAGAVLIRAIVPQEGVAAMQLRRGQVPARHLVDGPGKVCQALGITRAENGTDLSTSNELFIEEGVAAQPGEVLITPRIGVRGDEQALTRPWRFLWQPPAVVVGTR